MDYNSVKVDDSLCTSCRCLNFLDMFKQVDLHTWKDRHCVPGGANTKCWRSLGYLDDIAKRKYCAFCRLVIQSICSSRPDQILTPEDLTRLKTSDGGRVTCGISPAVAGSRTSRNGQVHKAITLSITSNRSLSLESSRLRFPHGEIKLAADDAVSIGELPLYHGRLLQECVDLNLVRGWIQNCKENHTFECDYTPWEKIRQFPSGLRLIDVKRMCIVKASKHSRYIALSYVWGNAKIIQLTMRNKLSMEKDSSLAKRTDILGQTLLDSIQLVGCLGERYLWCDQLCIVQDNLKEKIEQISQMGLIYAQAVLSIIAAGGTNADASLPGLRPGSRSVTQNTEVIQGLRLLVPMPMLSQQLHTSMWNTRAWTFQERLLSRRSLIFTDRQVHFDCRCDAMREDVVCERVSSDLSQDTFHYTPDFGALKLFPKSTSLFESSSIRSVGLLSKVKATPWPDTWKSYSQLIELYSAKSLSYPRDILLAFEGAQVVCKKMYEWSFFKGLPKEIWDHALLWRPKDSIDRRILEDEDTPKQQLVLPTYSWTAWIGPVTYRPWHSGLVSRTDHFELHGEHFMSVIKRKRQIPSANIGHQMFEYNPPIISLPTVPRQPRTSKAALSLDRIGTLDQDPPGKNPSNPEEWLQFWALAAPTPVSLKNIHVPVDKPTVAARELDTDEGLTTPDTWPRIWIYDQDHRKAGFLWIAPLVDVKDELTELVLLSQSGSNTPVDGYYEPNIDEWDDYRECMLNVMLIRWRGEFAERITIGRMHESAWNAASPKKKLIRLA